MKAFHPKATFGCLKNSLKARQILLLTASIFLLTACNPQNNSSVPEVDKLSAGFKFPAHEYKPETWTTNPPDNPDEAPAIAGLIGPVRFIQGDQIQIEED